MPDLAGVRVVVTRAAHQAEELAAPLRRLGADVLLAPMIDIGPPLDDEPLRTAAAEAAAYQWIVFSSANAVRAFASALEGAGVPRDSLSSQVAVIGQSTKTVALRHGFRVSLSPPDQIAESLVQSLSAKKIAGQKILLPSPLVTRDVLAPSLRRLGAHVTVVEAYRNVLPANARVTAAAVFSAPLPQWVTFASSSAAENTAALVSPDLLRQIKIASIGPATSRTVEALGLTVAAEARPYSVEGLVQALFVRQFRG